MTDELKSTRTHCDYCGHRLDPSVYFCPACSKPCRDVNLLLTPSAPAFENIETDIRTKAPEIWTVFFGFLSALGISGFLGIALWGTENREPTLLFVSIVLAAVTAACVVRYWSDVKPLLAKSGFLNPPAWAGLLALAPLLFLNHAYHQFLVGILDARTDDYAEVFTSSYGPVLFICVMPAVVEELAFRGVIQHRLESVVNPWIAIGAASVLFSVAHFSILSAPYLLLVGVLLGWMKWKTASLYPSMLAHFIHNYVVIAHFPS